MTKWFDKYSRVFFDAPDDMGGGGDGEDMGGGDGGDGGAGDAGGAPAAPAAPAFDPSALASAFAESLKTAGFGPAAEPAKPTMTPEEAAKLLKVWEPDDAFLQEFGNVDTQLGAFKKMRDGLSAHFQTVLQAQLERVRQEFSPIMQEVQTQREAALDTQFSTAYPQLGKSELKPLRDAVTQQLLQQGKRFGSPAEAFKAVAEGVAAVLKVSNPNFTLSPASAGGSTSTIPVTSPGGGGGGGSKGGGGGATGTPRAVSLLPPVRG